MYNRRLAYIEVVYTEWKELKTRAYVYAVELKTTGICIAEDQNIRKQCKQNGKN